MPYENCSSCGGSGKNTCSACGGTGLSVHGAYNMCQVSGCSGGFVRCSSCRGSGQRYVSKPVAPKRSSSHNRSQSNKEPVSHGGNGEPLPPMAIGVIVGLVALIFVGYWIAQIPFRSLLSIPHYVWDEEEFHGYDINKEDVLAVANVDETKHSLFSAKSYACRVEQCYVVASIHPDDQSVRPLTEDRIRELFPQVKQGSDIVQTRGMMPYQSEKRDLAAYKLHNQIWWGLLTGWGVINSRHSKAVKDNMWQFFKDHPDAQILQCLYTRRKGLYRKLHWYKRQPQGYDPQTLIGTFGNNRHPLQLIDYPIAACPAERAFQ